VKKRLYLLVAVVLLMGLSPPPIAAGDDIIMYVSDVTPTCRPPGNGLIFIGSVTIKDVDGHPVQRAKATAQLRLVDLYGYTTLTETTTAVTSPNRVATFRITGPARWFCVTVDSVMKTGYVYAPSLNDETGDCLDMLLWSEILTTAPVSGHGPTENGPMVGRDLL
jgi:hypothetical protein